VRPLLLAVLLAGCAQPQGITEGELPPPKPTITPVPTPEYEAPPAFVPNEPEPTPALPGPPSELLVGSWAIEVSDLDQQRLDGARRMAAEGGPERQRVLANLEQALSMRMEVTKTSLQLVGGPAGDQPARSLAVVEESEEELTIDLTSRHQGKERTERLTLRFDGPDRVEMSPEGTYDPLRFVRAR